MISLFLLILIIFSIIGILISSNLANFLNIQTNILFFLFIEIFSISIISLVISILKQRIIPKKIDLEEIFTGGAAKPPYINSNEIFYPLKKSEENG